MADLPDLDTTQIGCIGYWNALDHGASSVDPTNITNLNNAVNPEWYDNGVDFTYELPQLLDTRYDRYGQVNINVRVKTDGWHIAWLPTGGQYSANTYYANEWPYNGQYDLIHNWRSAPYSNGSGTHHPLPESTLSHTIDPVRTETCDGAETFAHADVGLYCYDYSNATQIENYLEYRANSNHPQAGIQYDSNTTRHAHFLTSSGWSDSQSYTCEIGFDGYRLISYLGHVAAVDAMAENLLPNTDTMYYHTSGSISGSNREWELQHLMFTS